VRVRPTSSLFTSQFIIFLFWSNVLSLYFMSLQISILTPERPFFDGQAEEIILPTETGEMGVLNNHAPIITGLDVGAMLIRTKDQWNSVALMGGFAVVKKNQVTILANEAEAAESINADEAKAAFEEAKANLEKAEGAKQKVEANFAFKRAKARFQVVKVVNKCAFLSRVAVALVFSTASPLMRKWLKTTPRWKRMVSPC